MAGKEELKERRERQLAALMAEIFLCSQSDDVRMYRDSSPKVMATAYKWWDLLVHICSWHKIVVKKDSNSNLIKH